MLDMICNRQAGGVKQGTPFPVRLAVLDVVGEAPAIQKIEKTEPLISGMLVVAVEK